MRKIIGKVVAIGLVATMILSLVACGNNEATEDVDNAVVSGSTSEQAEDDKNKDDDKQTDDNGEPVQSAGNLDIAWTETHKGEDFQVSDLFAVNSVTNLAPAGSGKALKVNVVIYDDVMTDTGVALTEEPVYEANFYQWFDEDGRLNWMRDIVSSDEPVTNSWNVVDTKAGYGYSTVWSKDAGLKSRKVYTNTANQMATCDTFYPLYTLSEVAKPYSYDPELYVEDGDAYAEQMRASTWQVPLADNNSNGFTAYIDDNMNVQVLVVDTMLGVSEAAIPTLIDIADVPATPDVESDTVMCDMSVNGTDISVPMLKDVVNTIFTANDVDYAVNEKITVDKAVAIVDDEGNDAGTATEIVNNEDALMEFKITEPVKFTVTYEYPEATADEPVDETAGSESEAETSASKAVEETEEPAA